MLSNGDSVLAREKVENSMDEYAALFEGQTGKHSANGLTDAKGAVTSAESIKKRQEGYRTMVNNFYDLVTDFYEYGCRLGMKPGVKALDVGCGVGGPMRNMAIFSGASIEGITINEYQVKPGGLFAGYEWVVLRTAATTARTRRTPPSEGIEIATPPDCDAGEGRRGPEAAGFEVLEHYDANRNVHSPVEIPWYDTLNGKFTLSGFRDQPRRNCTHAMVTALETLRIAPAGTPIVADRLDATAYGARLARWCDLGAARSGDRTAQIVILHRWKPFEHDGADKLHEARGEASWPGAGRAATPGAPDETDIRRGSNASSLAPNAGGARRRRAAGAAEAAGRAWTVAHPSTPPRRFSEIGKVSGEDLATKRDARRHLRRAVRGPERIRASRAATARFMDAAGRGTPGVAEELALQIAEERIKEHATKVKSAKGHNMEFDPGAPLNVATRPSTPSSAVGIDKDGKEPALQLRVPRPPLARAAQSIERQALRPKNKSAGRAKGEKKRKQTVAAYDDKRRADPASSRAVVFRAAAAAGLPSPSPPQPSRVSCG
ncbi:sterol 24-C-methyltransferase [Aureococcus anophagefferens]|nr:sterol 24-C-methyltransferase [Aureococcus anophagefferens]